MNLVRGFWRIVRWPILVVVVILGGLFIYELIRYPERSRETVQIIHEQKITIADVDGTNLPPAPNGAEVDATVEGVDVNGNGIRDDVELAIFEKYPNDQKVRAAALQYAKAAQNYLSLVISTDTLVAAAQQEERASSCLTELVKPFAAVQSLKKFIKETTVNITERQERANENTRLISSFSSLPAPYCDVEF